jgi:hypothetical protein
MTSLVNTLRKQVDIPIWEWLRFSPIASAVPSATCCANNSLYNQTHGRYLYFLITAANFWRYDTWSDTYEQLQTPPIAPATWADIEFDQTQAIEGLVLAATSNTITIPAYSSKALLGYDIKIIGGTGMGQRKLITDVAEPMTFDTGVVTGVNNVLGSLTITDSTKAWTVNQWAGYQVRISYGTGIGQVRLILYNSATVLTLGDSTLSAQNVWCNPNITSPAIVATAGSQSIYTIEASVVTVDSNWLTTPDITSQYRVESGVISLASSAVAQPFYTAQYYNIVSDTWYIKTAVTLNLPGVASDGSLDHSGSAATVWARGTSSAVGTTTTLIDSTHTWAINQFVGNQVYFFSGTGEGQIAKIASNTATTLTFAAVTTAPDTTTNYVIEGYDCGTVTTGSASSIIDSSKAWPVNRFANFMVKILFGTGKGQFTQIASNTATTLTLVKSFSVATDTTSVYTIIPDGEKTYCMAGGAAGAMIYNYSDDLPTFGRWQDSGIACNAVVLYSSLRPIGIASATHATTTATITTSFPHCLKVGMSVTVKGMTDSNYNTTATILTVPSTTSFTYTMAGTPAADTLAGSQSTSTLCDETKAWTVNQWAGYICYSTVSAVTAATGLATGQAFQIASNTATTLTFVTTGTAPITGVSRYIITPRLSPGMLDNGLATGTQSTVLITDTNKSGTFTGSMSSGSTTLTVSTAPAGYLSSGGITSITGTSIPAGAVIINQLTSTATGGVLGSTGTYQLSMASTAVISAATISYAWVVNGLAGRKVKIIAGPGQGTTSEVSITSNTANALTVGTLGTSATTAASSYIIFQQTARGTGIDLQGIFGLSTPTGYPGSSPNSGKYWVIARGGGAVGFDRLDITTDTFYAMPTTPQTETLSTGSMYAYDGQNRIYFTKEATQRMYYIDLNTNTIHGAGMYPYAAPAALLGNRMEIFSTMDGLRYLWINRETNLENFRQLLFY